MQFIYNVTFVFTVWIRVHSIRKVKLLGGGVTCTLFWKSIRGGGGCHIWKRLYIEEGLFESYVGLPTSLFLFFFSCVIQHCLINTHHALAFCDGIQADQGHGVPLKSKK